VSCCTSNEVPGGTFLLSYDGVDYTTKGGQATLSGFRLDRFEVTVGRFRRFVAELPPKAGANAWKPAPGSGKHSHLNGGQGLVDRSPEAGIGYETGWQPAWDSYVTSNALPSDLTQCGSLGTWTDAAAPTDVLPINCLNWFQAYAFCIWDGGFLPTEAEWNYAASGGAEQRVYPWSSPPAETTISCANANFISTRGCGYQDGVTANPVGYPDSGLSRWYQADLAGNVFEWTMDISTPITDTEYGSPAYSCVDCAFLGPRDAGTGNNRVRRGGGFYSLASLLHNAARGSNADNTGAATLGLRCARPP
jgi:formylglycine-generating enzyme required for sulfatase activity